MEISNLSALYATESGKVLFFSHVDLLETALNIYKDKFHNVIFNLEDTNGKYLNFQLEANYIDHILGVKFDKLKKHFGDAAISTGVDRMEWLIENKEYVYNLIVNKKVYFNDIFSDFFLDKLYSFNGTKDFALNSIRFILPFDNRKMHSNSFDSLVKPHFLVGVESEYGMYMIGLTKRKNNSSSIFSVFTNIPIQEDCKFVQTQKIIPIKTVSMIDATNRQVNDIHECVDFAANIKFNFKFASLYGAYVDIEKLYFDLLRYYEGIVKRFENATNKSSELEDYVRILSAEVKDLKKLLEVMTLENQGLVSSLECSNDKCDVLIQNVALLTQENSSLNTSKGNLNKTITVLRICIDELLEYMKKLDKKYSKIGRVSDKLMQTNVAIKRENEMLILENEILRTKCDLKDNVDNSDYKLAVVDGAYIISKDGVLIANGLINMPNTIGMIGITNDMYDFILQNTIVEKGNIFKRIINRKKK